MEALIELTTRPRQLVLDPYAGSGTTAVAAAALGRSYVAIERDPEYCRVLRARLAKVQRQLL
jgi:DNA modification methylase